MSNKTTELLSAGFCFCVCLLISCPAIAGEEYLPGEETATSKPLIVACFNKGFLAIPGCNVRFTSGNYKHGCVTSASGSCRIFLECCRAEDGLPMIWTSAAISSYGRIEGQEMKTACDMACKTPEKIRFQY